MTPFSAGEIARALGRSVEALCVDLLPGGHREGAEWRCGSVAGDAGHSLGVHLTGAKAGIWCDFASGQRGDALDLVRAVLRLGMREALEWSRRWLGLADGAVELPSAPIARSDPVPASADPDRWRRPWQSARPIGGTLAETYLAGRGLWFADRDGDALRFCACRARRSPAGVLEHRPALLALLSDVRTGEPCGAANVYLRPDGSDRLRDSKGRTVTGRARGAAVMLGDFADVTMGLTVCEGVETGIALVMAGLAPVWALGGAANLAAMPVFGGIEALTIAADADDPGRRAAEVCAARTRAVGCEVAIIAPPAVGTDWADGRRPAA